MLRLYSWTMSRLGCCGCGCIFFPFAAVTALGSGGFLTWQVVN